MEEIRRPVARGDNRRVDALRSEVVIGTSQGLEQLPSNSTKPVLRTMSDDTEEMRKEDGTPSSSEIRNRQRDADVAAVDDVPQLSNWSALMFGQSIALVAATMNAVSFTLWNRYEVKTQLFQLFCMYILLSTHMLLVDNRYFHIPAELHHDHHRESSDDGNEDVSTTNVYLLPFLPSCFRIRLRAPWWVYFFISCLDVFPNLLTLLSFRYTSLTSTTLLGSLTVPSTMLFSRFIMSKHFRCHHYVGVLLCVIGGSLTLYMDTESTNESRDHISTSSYIGDILAVSAALMYGLGDTIAEYWVKQLDRYEYLGMLGFFGILLIGVTFPWIEFDALRDLLKSQEHPLEVAALLGVYVASVLLYYMSEAKFLVTSDATLLNLSMQSVNLWAFLFSFGTSQNLPPALFFVALVLVVSGVFVYEMGIFHDSKCRTNKPRSSSEVEIIQGETENYRTLVAA
jgi:solute carrier family 35, member F1/2